MPVIKEMGILFGYCFLMNYVKSAEAVRFCDGLRLRGGNDFRIEYKICFWDELQLNYKKNTNQRSK